MSKFFYFDLETTGLNPEVHGITEIAFIIVNNGKEYRHEFKVNAFSYKRDNSVSLKALETTNKTIEEILSYEDSASVFEKVYEILNDHIDPYDKTDKFDVIGYNVNFDMNFLHEWFKDNGNPYCFSYFNGRVVDVHALVVVLRSLGVLELESTKLSKVCESLGIELVDAHEALGDIVATRELYVKLVNEYIKV